MGFGSRFLSFNIHWPLACLGGYGLGELVRWLEQGTSPRLGEQFGRLRWLRSRCACARRLVVAYPAINLPLGGPGPGGWPGGPGGPPARPDVRERIAADASRMAIYAARKRRAEALRLVHRQRIRDFSRRARFRRPRHGIRPARHGPRRTARDGTGRNARHGTRRTRPRAADRAWDPAGRGRASGWADQASGLRTTARRGARRPGDGHGTGHAASAAGSESTPGPGAQTPSGRQAGRGGRAVVGWACSA